jgi:hypothetical protein
MPAVDQLPPLAEVEASASIEVMLRRAVSPSLRRAITDQLHAPGQGSA